MPVPQLLIFRFIHQTLETLRFMYTLPRPVTHYDLTEGNILVSWKHGQLPDFIVGDMGLSRLLETVEIATDIPWNRNPLRWDVGEVLDIARGMVRTGHGEFRKGEDIPARPGYEELRAVLSELKRLHELHLNRLYSPSGIARNAVNPLEFKFMWPDFTAVIRMARESEQSLLSRPGTDIEDLHSIHKDQLDRARLAVPRTYDTKEEILAARGVHGPWYVATVDSRDWELLTTETRSQNGPI
jgi:hypothetical protein